MDINEKANKCATEQLLSIKQVISDLRNYEFDYILSCLKTCYILGRIDYHEENMRPKEMENLGK